MKECDWPGLGKSFMAEDAVIDGYWERIHYI